MKAKLNFLSVLGMTALLASCSGYHHISDNDVYSQRPTEISLNEDETDLTSFNSFRARENGAFRDEIDDVRVNQRDTWGASTFWGGFAPFGMSYGFMNSPMSFHGMGYDFYGYPYGGYYYPGGNRFGFRFGAGLGNPLSNYAGIGPFANPYYYDQFYYGSSYFYNPYHYGFMNPYSNPYYYGDPYYGGGHVSSVGNSGGMLDNSNTYYGPRAGLNSSSSRSSSYPSTTGTTAGKPGTNVPSTRRQLNSVSTYTPTTGVTSTPSNPRTTASSATRRIQPTSSTGANTSRSIQGTTVAPNRNLQPNSSLNNSNPNLRRGATTTPSRTSPSRITPSPTNRGVSPTRTEPARNNMRPSSSSSFSREGSSGTTRSSSGTSGTSRTGVSGRR